MKKIYVLILFVSILLIGCSGFSELKENIAGSNKFQHSISKLAVKLDDSLKFIKLRQKKLKISEFGSLNKRNSTIGKYIKLKLEEELFKLGYIISTDEGIIEVSGRYIDFGDKIEIIAYMKGEGIKIAESSVLVKKDRAIGNLLNNNQTYFLSSER